MNIFRSQLIIALALGIFAVGCDVDSANEDVDSDNAALNAKKEISKALASFSPEDQELAAAQRFCPVHVYRHLGSMGTPVKVATTGKPIFVCSKECVDEAQKGGAAIKRIASGLRKSNARLAELPPEERAIAESQKYCPVMSSRLLGTMGAPVKLVFDGKPVYLCCPDCVADAESDPAEMLARVEKLKLQKVGMKEMHGHHKQDDHAGKHDDHQQ